MITLKNWIVCRRKIPMHEKTDKCRLVVSLCLQYPNHHWMKVFSAGLTRTLDTFNWASMLLLILVQIVGHDPVKVVFLFAVWHETDRTALLTIYYVFVRGDPIVMETGQIYIFRYGAIRALLQRGQISLI